MKILLVCAAGMSTSILMQKMEKYAANAGIELEIAAKGLFEYSDACEGCDVLLLGPQISYKKEEIEKQSNKPVFVINPLEYAVGDAGAIFKQIENIPPARNGRAVNDK
jgi:PTS system cellobiose-specific IIB component